MIRARSSAARKRVIILALAVVVIVGVVTTPFVTGNAALVRSDATPPGTFTLFPNPHPAPFGLSDACAITRFAFPRDLLPDPIAGDMRRLTSASDRDADATYTGPRGDTQIAVHRYGLTDEARAAVAQTAGMVDQPRILRQRLDASKYWMRDYFLYDDERTAGRSGIVYNCAGYVVVIDASTPVLRDAYAHATHDDER